MNKRLLLRVAFALLMMGWMFASRSYEFNVLPPDQMLQASEPVRTDSSPLVGYVWLERFEPLEGK